MWPLKAAICSSRYSEGSLQQCTSGDRCDERSLLFRFCKIDVSYESVATLFLGVLRHSRTSRQPINICKQRGITSSTMWSLKCVCMQACLCVCARVRACVHACGACLSVWVGVNHIDCIDTDVNDDGTILDPITAQHLRSATRGNHDIGFPADFGAIGRPGVDLPFINASVHLTISCRALVDCMHV